MSNFRRSQPRQPLAVDVVEDRSPKVVSPPPPITHALLSETQGIRTTDALAFSSKPETHTDQLGYISQFSPVTDMVPVTHELKEPRVTRQLEQGHATQALVNTARTTRVLTNPQTDALAGTFTAPIREAVVIPGKRKKKIEPASPARRMHPYLRYSLVVGAMMTIIGIALGTLTPLNDDQAQLPVLGGVVRWIQTQDIAWNVGSHMDDQAQVTNTQNTTTTTTENTSPPITILPTSQYVEIAREAATAAGISPTYFVNQINAESSFNPNAISPVGAVGIAQFMPSTAASLGINPYDPIQALTGAARHMANLSRMYNGDYAKALAAYNAGSGTVNYVVSAGGANWRALLPYETQQYIYKIMGY